MQTRHLRLILLVITGVALIGCLRAQTLPTPPRDQRLKALLGEKGDFSFTPPASVADWQQRSDRVRNILRVTLGLWPAPTRTPLKPTIHGRISFDDYTIEKVILESAPGFFLTGNLYRPSPSNSKQRHPAVLSPHGHFPGGRFIDEGQHGVRMKIAAGAERFENGGRSFMQSRCVQLARMGCVVFHYDMIGYGDSLQIPLDVAHRFSGLRRSFTEPPITGFYSARSEQHLFNPMGLHVWNSQRALDFLSSLPDVDPERIAVTGGSGGGTQTFMLCAVDDRPLVSVPVVILSTTRQGGCTCENISGLRWGSFNLEFAALHAPKPQMLISADDATRTMTERGFPELSSLYQLLGSRSHVSHTSLLHFPHNYNYVSRTAMYHWLNRHLQLGHEEPILERDYDRQSQEKLTVWNEQHPQPSSHPEFVDQLRDWFAEDAQQQLAALTPDQPGQMQRYRHVVGKGWSVILRKLPSHFAPTWSPLKTIQQSGNEVTHGELSYLTFNGRQARLPVVRIKPSTTNRSPTSSLIWFHPRGKASLTEANGTLRSEVQRALENGHVVIGADLFQQGEYLGGKTAPQRQRHLPGEEAFAGWTYCYNLPLFAQRTYDAMAVMSWATQQHQDAGKFNLLARGQAGPIAGAALALGSWSRLRSSFIETEGFRFKNVEHVYDADFLPGAVKYGDLPGLLALAAPQRLRISGESEASLSLVRAAYHSEGLSDHLQLGDWTAQEAIEWLSQKP